MQPSMLVVFGFTGDLTKRKLIPALLKLEELSKLHEGFQIVGISRREMTVDQYRQGLSEYVDDKFDQQVIDRLCQRIKIVVSKLDGVDDYRGVATSLNDIQDGTCQTRVFYLSVPPNVFESMIVNIAEAEMHACPGEVRSRLLVEKPFGHDLDSAKKLAEVVRSSFGEDETYLIDHYLAKDTAQNIMHFRFYNPLFDRVWNNQAISSIQITANEMLDIQGRANFYEQTGALRDMLQAHMMSILNLVTMDEPADINSTSIIDSRIKLLKSVRLFAGDNIDTNTARAQYNGYKDEVENPNSATETMAALRIEIDDNNWRGVPIYIRSGKAMDQKTTEVNVIFNSGRRDHHEQNILTFRIQPNEGIAVSLVGKKPGLEQVNQPITLDYCYEGEAQLSDAYERIFNDAIKGERGVFPTIEEMLLSWEFFDPILKHWQSRGKDGLGIYEKGAESVEAVDRLTELDGNKWHSNQSWICTPKTIPKEILEQLKKG